MGDSPEIRTSVFEWLLDQTQPGVRYLALRNLLRLSEADPELQAACRTAHSHGPIAAILAEMHPDGYWAEPGAGYYPKYRGSVWSIICLAQLGARIDQDPRIEKAAAYLLDATLSPTGQFSVNGAPSGTADCLQGNLCWALLELGLDPARLETAFDWLARSNTGEGVAPRSDKNAPVRYYAGKCGPLFACGSNNNLPCAWGGIKAMLAFGRLPPAYHTPQISQAIKAGIDFFLGVDPATAAYPNGWADKPSGNWWKFGFPVFYVSDLLQLVETLQLNGCGNDPRLAHALALIRQKQDAQGRWLLEYDYAGKTWLEWGGKKQANPWVSLRALSALSALQPAAA
jgi:hypothetical protein